MNEDQIRRDFEEWWLRFDGPLAKSDPKGFLKYYKQEEVDKAWATWQAAANKYEREGNE